MQLHAGNVPEAKSRAGRFPQTSKGNSPKMYLNSAEAGLQCFHSRGESEATRLQVKMNFSLQIPVDKERLEQMPSHFTDCLCYGATSWKPGVFVERNGFMNDRRMCRSTQGRGFTKTLFTGEQMVLFTNCLIKAVQINSCKGCFIRI